MAAEKKTYTAKVLIKGDAQPGDFQAVFATLNVKDLDGDVTVPGAFDNQKVVVEPWNHNYGELPVGRGAISEVGNEAVIDGKFFLDTPAGKDHYTVVKELADMQEWSYSFFIKEAEFGVFNGEDVRFLKKMDVIGVGPVTRGAGIDTRVTTIKGKKNDEGNNGEGEAEGKPSADVVRAEIELVELEE